MSDTYRYTGSSPLRRASSDPIQPGDEFEPTDLELDAFGDLLDPTLTLEDAMGDAHDASADDDAPNTSSSTETRQDDAQRAHDDSASDADDTSQVDVDNALVAFDGITNPDAYDELRATAKQFEDVSGNASKAELREQLAARSPIHD